MNQTTLLLRPDLGNRPYRLWCSVRVPAKPKGSYQRAMWERDLQRGMRKAVEWFIEDQKKDGFLYQSKYPLQVKGPFPPVDPITIHVVREPTSREMLPRLLQGWRPSASPPMPSLTAGTLEESEDWEFRVGLVFAHKTILLERPDEGEEIRP